MRIKIYKRGENVQLSKNFHLKEFECQCGKCSETKVDLDHVDHLQKKRDKLGKSIKINSAYRCPEHNKAIGGEEKSLHMEGTATDIVVLGMTPEEVAKECEDFDGVGRYDSFTHIDSRGSKARWNFRKKI